MIVTTNTPLNVPFKEKDEAKSHGARWNPAAKHWYIPEGVDDTPFAKWMDGAPAATHQPQQVQTQTAPVQSKSVQPTNAAPKSDLPKSADIDDINAMLRDAVESDESPF